MEPTQSATDCAFKLVQPEPLPFRTIFASLCVHAAAATVLFMLPLLWMEPLNVTRYSITLLVPQAQTQHELNIAQTSVQLPVIRKTETPVQSHQVPSIDVADLKVSTGFELPEPKSSLPDLRSLPATPRVEAPADTERHTRTIQTGGFGDPNGVSPKEQPRRRVDIAAVGSFDLPGGDGDGRSGKTAPAVAPGITFDAANRLAANGGTSRRAKAAYLNSAFETAAFANHEPHRQVAIPLEAPVEITYKPRPEYTADARRMLIQGDVSLRVLFRVSGSVEILAVLHGLGYGLDESAIRAAKQIQFKPASIDGLPVDSVATVRIVFQLAY